MGEDATLYCSFCGKSQHSVAFLIEGPSVFICDECTELCMSIVLERRLRAEPPHAALSRPLKSFAAEAPSHA